MTTLPTSLNAGDRVRVTQQMPFGQKALSTSVEGTVMRFGQEKTGSWFAHARDNKLWLDRIELKKDDGERVMVNLDQYSRVELLSGGA